VGVDGHDLDLVHATTDGLFKAMNSRMHSYGPTRVVCRERRNCHAPVTVNQAKRRTKRHQQQAARIVRVRKSSEIFFSSTRVQQVMHGGLTGFPQLDAREAAPYAERT
jgi:hypothetical protein